MPLIKKYRIIRCILFVMAFQVLNMSIDVPVVPVSAANEELNYIDTYIEYIAEVILKYENAIPESKQRQQKEFQLHKHVQIICEVISLPWLLPELTLIKDYPDYSNKYACQFIKEINPPPPKFC